MGEWALAVAIGFASGVLSGAFGIGGGIVTTPAIRLVLGVPSLIAVGTPLPVIIPGAVTGAASYHRKGLADVRSGLILGAAGAGTAVVGAILATRLGGSVVLIGTSALILYAAVDTILQIVADRGSHATSGASQGDSAPEPPRPPVPLLVGIGALTGLYSGFFGLGGGFVLVPMLTRWARFGIKRAIGTSLVTISLLAIPGTITHAVLGNIDWRITLGLALGVVPGAMVGAHITQGARDQRVRIAFAVLLIVVGLWLAVSEIGSALG